jgi:AraC-like DNA-binding protein
LIWVNPGVSLRQGDGGLAARVRDRLRGQQPGDWPTVEQMARILRMPCPRLRHRFGQEGQSYATIKEEIRRDLASALLLEGEKSVSDIALELGFAEPSLSIAPFANGRRKARERFSATPAARNESLGDAYFMPPAAPPSCRESPRRLPAGDSPRAAAVGG